MIYSLVADAIKVENIGSIVHIGHTGIEEQLAIAAEVKGISGREIEAMIIRQAATVEFIAVEHAQFGIGIIIGGNIIAIDAVLEAIISKKALSLRKGET